MMRRFRTLAEVAIEHSEHSMGRDAKAAAALWDD
jgi:hypothetical protein